MEQVTNKLQVKGVDSLFFPLSFHKHVGDIEYILHKCCYSCCCQYHVSGKELKSSEQ